MNDLFVDTKNVVSLTSYVSGSLKRLKNSCQTIMFNEEDLIVWSSTKPNPSAPEFWKKLLNNCMCQVRKELSGHSDAGDLAQQIQVLEEEVQEILNISKEYSACHIEINGYTALADKVVDFFDFLLAENYFRSAKPLEPVHKVVEIFRAFVRHLQVGHSRRLVGGKEYPNTKIENGLNLNISDMKEFDDWLELRVKMDENLETLYEHFYCFYANNTARFWYRSLARLLVFASEPFPKCLRIYDSKYVGSTFHRLLKTASNQTPVRTLGFCDTHSCRRLLNLITYTRQVTSKTLWIPAQKRWTIPVDRVGLEDNGHQPACKDLKYKVRCRLTTHTEIPNENGVLVFFCHGGAMIVLGAEFHEMYTKRFVGQLEGAAIFCPDYTLRAVYPVVFQELLDAYLWVISGDPSVEKALGFRVRKVVLAGDSIGATMAFALLSTLHRIERADPSVELIFPTDLVLYYAALFSNSMCSPSSLNSCFDAILTEGLLLVVGGCLAGVEGGENRPEHSSNGLMKFIRGVRDDLKALKYTISSRPTKPWYLMNEKPDIQAIKSVRNQISGTLQLCLIDVDFDRFSDTKLYLFTTAKCVFLDDNMDLARLWKGPVELHVAKRQTHGFLTIPGETKAFQFALDLLKKAVQGTSKS